MYQQTTQLAEVEFLMKKLENAVLPDGLKEKIDLMLKRMRRMARQGQQAGEYEQLAKYIDWCVAVPWGNYVQDNLDLNNAKQIMDARHYGREDLKESILEFLSVIKRKLMIGNPDYKLPVLAFIGVQGAGKTTMAKAIAESMGRPFYRISLGALGSSTELRGKAYGEVSSFPGQIIRGLTVTRCMNPVILLDEFDKVSGSEAARKDFMAILLEILDPQQNSSFRDWYLDYPTDLSKILFIATANTFKTVTRELLDRLEFIEFKDYTVEEKHIIAKNYLFPKVLEYAGLTQNELQINEDAWKILVSELGKDEGVRRLEKKLQWLARKITRQIVTGQIQSAMIDANYAQHFVNLVGTHSMEETMTHGRSYFNNQQEEDQTQQTQ